jgi:membrane protein YqaA with SNARE-associated domain
MENQPTLSTPVAADAPQPRNPLRRLYLWTVRWADTRWATPALVAVSFAESSFFPIPPDPLLMANCYAHPRRWWQQAAWCTLASVLGGLLGYWLGYEFRPAAESILRAVGVSDVAGKFAVVQGFYDKWGFLALVVKSLTPIPFKVFTIASGALHFDILKFILGAALGRALRFFLVAGLIRAFGERVRPWVEERIEWIIVVFFLILVAGFVALKFLHLGGH